MGIKADVMQLMGAFKDVTMGFAAKTGGDETVEFIKKITSSLEKTVSKLEGYLKAAKGVGQELLDKHQPEIDKYTGKAKALGKDFSDKKKEKGFWGALKETAVETKAKLLDKYANDTQKSQGPPEDGKTEEDTPIGAKASPAKVDSIIGPQLPNPMSPRSDDFVGPQRPTPETESKEGLFTPVINSIKDLKSSIEKLTNTNQESSPPEDGKTEEDTPIGAKASPAKVDSIIGPQLPNPMSPRSDDFVGPQRPTPETESKEGLFTPVINSIKDLKSSIEKLTNTNQESIEQNEEQAKQGEEKERKLTMREKLQGTFDKLTGRTSKRSKEVQGEKDGSKILPKVKGGGIFSKILSAVMGIGGIFTAGIKLLLGGLPLGIGKILVASLKGLGGVGTVLGMAGRVAGAIAPYAGAAIIGAGKLALTAATAVAGGGVAALATVAGVGLLISGGYKLYKYLSRNSVGSGVKGKMTRLRLLSYGFNDTHREHYNKVFELDMLMKNYVSNKAGKPHYAKFDTEFKDKVLTLFEVKRSETEKFKLINEWFLKRYFPAHAAFMQAYYTSGGKDYVDDIDKLSNDQTFTFASTYNLPETVYDFTQIPVFDNPNGVVTKAEIDAMLLDIRQLAKKDSDMHKGKDPEASQAEVLKKSAEDAVRKKLADDNMTKKAAQVASGDTKKSETPTTTPIGAKDSSTTSQGWRPTPPPGDEGEAKPKVTTDSSSENKPLQATIDKVAKAPGALAKGDKTLEGIKGEASKESIFNLDPNVFNLFTGMAKEYNNLTGKSISVTEAFRTKAEQQALRAKYGRRAAKPGTSLHEFGLAMDVNTPDVEALEKMGLLRKYGFTRPVSGETWHLEPAGVSFDPKSSKFDMSVRNQRVLSSPGRGGGGLGTNPNVPDNKKYKRDVILQRRLFDAGETIDIPVDPQASAEQDKPVQASTSSTPTDSTEGPIITQSPTDNTPASKTDETPVKETAKADTVWSPESKSFVPAKKSTNATSYSDLVSGIFGGKSKSPLPDKQPSPTDEAEIPPKETTKGPLTSVINSASKKPTGSQANADIRDLQNQSGLYKNKTTPTSQTPPVSPVAPKGLETPTTQPSVSQTQSNLDPGGYANLSPHQAVVQASKLVGMNPETMLAFARIESSMKPVNANPESSAKGLFQIVDPTWKELMGKHAAKYNIPSDASPNHAYYNSILGIAYAKDNLKILGDVSNKGVREDTALYLAHHFGAYGGKVIIDALGTSPNALMKSVVSKRSYNSNDKELVGKTVAQYIQYLNNKISKANKPWPGEDTPYASPGSKQAASTPTPTQSGVPSVTSSNTPEPSVSSKKPTESQANADIRDLQNQSGLYKNKTSTEPKKEVSSPTPSETPSAYANKPTPEAYVDFTGPPTPAQTGDTPWVDSNGYDEFGEYVGLPEGVVRKTTKSAPESREQYSPQKDSTDNRSWMDKADELTGKKKLPEYKDPPTSQDVYPLEKPAPGVVVPNPVSRTQERQPGAVISRMNEQVNSISKDISNFKLHLPQPGFAMTSKEPTTPATIAGSVASSIFGNKPERGVVVDQPSSALSLDKTESILTSMGDTLSQIKTILQSIHDKPQAMQGSSQQEQPQSQEQSQTPIQAPVNRMPSTMGLSMSRKSVLA